MTTLKNWSVVKFYRSEYNAPEQGVVVLKGKVFNHNKIKDGEDIITSKVLKFNSLTLSANTLNNSYKLEEPDQNWLNWLNTNSLNLQQFDFDISD